MMEQDNLSEFVACVAGHVLTPCYGWNAACKAPPLML